VRPHGCVYVCVCVCFHIQIVCVCVSVCVLRVNEANMDDEDVAG
jgi:hypothetical protein